MGVFIDVWKWVRDVEGELGVEIGGEDNGLSGRHKAGNKRLWVYG